MAPWGAVTESRKTMGRSERGGLFYFKQVEITVEISDGLLAKTRKYGAHHGTNDARSD